MHLVLGDVRAAAPASIRLGAMANQLATEFLAQNPEGDAAALETYLEQEQVVGEAARAVMQTVELAGELAELGLKPGTRAFGLALADNTGAGVATTQLAAPAATVAKKPSDGSGPTLRTATTVPPPTSTPAPTPHSPPPTADQLREQVLVLDLAAAEEKARITTGGEREIAENVVDRLTGELQLVRAQLKYEQAVEAEKKAAAADKPSTEKTKAALVEATTDRELSGIALKTLVERSEDRTPAFATNGPTNFVHAGVRLLSPYKYIFTPADPASNTRARGEISAAGSEDTAAFAEFVYANRWAWNPLRLEKATTKPRVLDQSQQMPKDSTRKFPWSGVATSLDFETRVTYNFSQSKSDAAAIVGTGDFGAEISIAPLIPHFHHLHDDSDWTKGGWSINPEFSLGVTTDKNVHDSHRREFFGLSYTLSYNLGGTDTRWLLFNTRVGIANLDSLTYLSDDSTEIELMNGNLPRYSMHSHKAIEVDVIYPLSRDSHLTFGGRVYNGRKPNMWTLHLGYTRSISDIVKGILPNFGEDQPKPADPKTKKQPSPPSL